MARSQQHHPLIEEQLINLPLVLSRSCTKNRSGDSISTTYREHIQDEWIIHYFVGRQIYISFYVWKIDSWRAGYSQGLRKLTRLARTRPGTSRWDQHIPRATRLPTFSTRFPCQPAEIVLLDNIWETSDCVNEPNSTSSIARIFLSLTSYSRVFVGATWMTEEGAICIVICWVEFRILIISGCRTDISSHLTLKHQSQSKALRYIPCCFSSTRTSFST